MGALIRQLDDHYANDPNVYVSGNLLIYNERGNRRRRVAPDVFVVKGVPKYDRPNYLIWEEGKGPDFVIELTSSSTRNDDLEDKFALYRDTLRVKEYFLFDPFGDYLDPQLQGYRLRGGAYHAIRAVEGRLPSRVTGLHLEGRGRELRLYDPVSDRVLPTPAEVIAEEQAARRREASARRAAEAARRAASAARRAAEAEAERLRRELDELRRRQP
jgi:Uma2 family endonuclease